MKNDLYPDLLVETLGRKEMDYRFPMRVVSIDDTENSILCEIEETTWKCNIPESYGVYREHLRALIMRNELYAFVDISNRLDSMSMMMISPDKQHQPHGTFIEFGTLMLNHDMITGERRIAAYKKLSNDMVVALCPIVRIDKLMGRFQANGICEMTYQLVFPGAVVVKAGKNVRKLDNSCITNGKRIESFSDWITHYNPIMKYYDWLTNRDNLKFNTGLETASHIAWRDLIAEADGDEIKQLKGSADDPREMFDTPRSIRSRYLYNIYNIQNIVPSEKIRFINHERYTPLQFVKEMHKKLNRNSPIVMHTYNPIKKNWMMHGGESDGFRRENLNKIVENVSFWQTPFVVIGEKRDSKWMLELAFIDLHEMVKPDVIVDNVSRQGRLDLINYSTNNPRSIKSIQVRHAFDTVFPISKIQFALKHEGTLFRGTKHLISYVTHEDKWFYHGYFEDKAPGTLELYYNVCDILAATFRNRYPTRNIIIETLENEEWIPRIPRDLHRMMSIQFIPIFEIPNKKNNYQQ